MYCLFDTYYGIVPIIILFSAFIVFFSTVDPLHTDIDYSVSSKQMETIGSNE